MCATLRYARHPTVILLAYIAAWLACGWFTWQRAEHAWKEFHDDQRPDGDTGHVQIDFAGQWVMARLFVDDGRRLYQRDRQRELLRQAFPAEDESPTAPAHDADALMGWFLGTDRPAGTGVGGPLYPPVHGLLYAPLGRLSPLTAYRTFQTLSVALAVFAGLAISRATGGRVWFPVAMLGIVMFPGCRGGLDLGQNHLLTLAVVAAGWWAMTAGRWTLGGAVWGLLALKPTWAVAFLPVLLVMGQWRTATAMCGTAAGLIVLTLPVVGIHGWLDWLSVGREATATYAVNENWVCLSRDLGGLPRRLLIDFDRPVDGRDSRQAALLGWALWSLVVVGTVVTYRLCRDRRPTGLAAGFLLLGAYLSCYRFMYYDATLATLPVGLMLAERRVRRAWLPLALLATLYAYENWLMHYRLELTLSSGASTGRYSESQAGQRLVTLAGNYMYAWDTALLLALWAWAGGRLLLDTYQGPEGGPDVGRPHKRLADEDR